MRTTTDYINQLENDKKTLSNSLNLKGISTNSDEDYNELISKVDEISQDSLSYNEYFIDKPLSTHDFSTGSTNFSSIIRTIIKYVPDINIDVTENTYSNYLAISGDNILSIGNITINSKSESSTAKEVDISLSLKNVRYIGKLVNNIDIPVSFYLGNTNYIEIIDLSNLSKLTDISFSNNTSLRKIIFGDVKVVPTSSSYYMGSSFDGNKSLEEIDISVFDFKTNSTSVSNLSRCFYNCNNLKHIYNFNNIDTSSVTDFSYCFYECNSLESIDLSNLNLSSISSDSKLFYMFYHCNSLENLDFSNVIFKNNTFYSNIISNANAKKLTLKNQSLLIDDLSGLFSNWDNLESIDLTGSSLSTTEDEISIANLFNKCSKISYIDLTPFGLNNKKISNISQAFNYCSNLKEIKMSIYFSSNCSINYFLYNCNSLQKIDGIIDMTEFNKDMTHYLGSSGNLFYGLSENTNELDIKIKNIKVSVYFLQASKVNFSEESINYLLNNVQDVTSNPKKLRFDSSVLAKASADAIAHAESLGWTITT